MAKTAMENCTERVMGSLIKSATMSIKIDEEREMCRKQGYIQGCENF